MEHFDIVLALVRAALETKNSRVVHQVERLRDALSKEDRDQAAKLSRLLTAVQKKQSMAPLAFDEMRHLSGAARMRLSGELLTRNTPLPVDKETGAPLVRVTFPDDAVGIAPVFPRALTEAVTALLEEWRKLDRLAELQTQPQLRCLLYGAPGVGKTMFARHIARHLDLPCVEARLDGLVSSFLGTTGRNIGSLFMFANRYRCLLFLDEFDALAKARDDAHELGEIKRVVNTLLQSLDEREGRGFTIAATNHEHLLDSAIWRRFDARIEVPKPDVDARREILALQLRPLEFDTGARSFLEWITEGFTGADLANVAAAVKRYVALNEEVGLHVSPALLVAALRRFVVMNGKVFGADRIAAIAGDREKLDQALTGVGLNQSERAEILGVSQSTISRAGKTNKRRAGKNKQNE